MENDDSRLGGRVQLVSEKPLLHRFGKQILMSVIASIIAASIVNTTGIVRAVRYAASIIVHTTGDIVTGDDGLAKKIQDKAGDYTKDHPGTLPVPVGGLSLNPFGKTPAQLAAEAERLRQERERKEAAERAKWIARAEAVGLEYSDDWTNEDFKVKVPNAEQQAAYDAERKSLLATAAELKMIVNDDWNNKDLKQAIKEEKEFQWLDTEYQARKRRWLETVAERNELLLTGPNARCPDRRCGYQLRFSPSRTGKYVCPHCHGHYTVSQARSCFVPPPVPREPLPPRRKPSLLKRMFG